MKYVYGVVSLSILFVAAWALPTDYSFEANATRTLSRQAGFSTLHGGTYGGEGGSVFTVWDPWALRDALNSNSPRIVYVRGRLDLTQLFVPGSFGVSFRIGSFTSVIGGDSNAEIFGGGLVVDNNRQVIIRNIRFNNALSYQPGEVPDGSGGIVAMLPGDYSVIDAIGLDTAEHVWVDHCEFSDDPWIAANIPSGGRRHDGLIDIRLGANWITVSNNIFRNHNLVSLIGASDNNVDINAGKLKITFYGNWFMHVIQRCPFARFGEIHVFNNLYTDISDYAIGAGVLVQIYAERNVFINVRRSFVGNSNPPGHILPVDNWLINSGQDAGVPSAVTWRPSNYYNYNILPTADVERSVRANAGVW